MPAPKQKDAPNDTSAYLIPTPTANASASSKLSKRKRQSGVDIPDIMDKTSAPSTEISEKPNKKKKKTTKSTPRQQLVEQDKAPQISSKRDSIASPQSNDPASDVLHAIVSAAAPGLQPSSSSGPNQPSEASGLPTQNMAPFSDISFGSSDDIIRALQDLDVSKLTEVLKGLNQTGPESSFQLSENVINQEQGTSSTSNPRPSTSRSTQPVRVKHTTSSGTMRTVDMTLPAPENATTPNHAYLLANKWLTATKLNQLAESEGLVFKKGKFSAIEAKQIENAIETYQKNRGLTKEDIRGIVFPADKKSKDNQFWTEITSAVSQRPLVAVYHYLRRALNEVGRKGVWVKEEDDKLRTAVVQHGPKWEHIAPMVGRSASDCRDRWRNHVKEMGERNTGPWTKEEEEELTNIVNAMTVDQGRNLDSEIFWTTVSEKMRHKRGRQQCRIKWTDSLMAQVKNEGRKARWGSVDSFILVHKIDSMNVRDDTEIDWKIMSDPDWNLWSAHIMQRRWLTIKRGVKGHEEMTHPEIMDILRQKYGELPVESVDPAKWMTRKNRRLRVPTSAEMVDEGTDGETNDDE